MTGAAGRDWIHQEWVHSHEEDRGDEMVFRPASFPFPPSRGRRSIDLRPGGALARGGPGPDDRRVRSEGGRWQLAGKTLKLHAPSSAAYTEAFEMVSASPDRLVLRPVSP
jgi:hypothetical protein